MEYERAIALGHKNERAITLLANHCLHARPTIHTSFLGAEVGLPIGRAEIACDYAPFFGMSTMDLTNLAAMFYEENCESCPHRFPTGQLPTIASVVEQIRLQRDSEASRRAERHRANHDAWSKRRERRETALLSESYLVRDLGQYITVVDAEPGIDEHNEEAVAIARQKLLETARQAPQLFCDVLVDDLVRLARDFDPTAIATLGFLAVGGAVPKQLVVAISVEALHREPIVEAGDAIAALHDCLTPDDVAYACPGAVHLAADPEWSFPNMRRESHPEAIIALGLASWEPVRQFLLNALSSDDDSSREAACHAARHLLTANPSRLSDLGEALIRSIRGEDSGYAGRPAPAVAATRALALGWIAFPDQTIALIEEGAAELGNEARKALMRVCRFVIHADDNASNHNVHLESVVDFLIRRLDGGWNSECANEACDDLELIASEKPSALIPNTDALVGALLRECSAPSTRTVLLPPTKQPADAIDQRTEAIMRRRRARDLAHCLGLVARITPGVAFPRVFAVLDADTGDAEHDRTVRPVFIEVLEHGVTAETLSHLLPRLYTMLLSTDPSSRGAAVRLWRQCARNARMLPRELADLAGALLADPYYAVHGAMVESLLRLHLSDEKLIELLPTVLGIAKYHSADNGNSQILKSALTSAIAIAARVSDRQIQEMVSTFVIRATSALDASPQEQILLNHDLRHIRGTTTWAVAALKALADPHRLVWTISPRDDRLLQAFLEQTYHVRDTPLAMFTDVARLNTPASLSGPFEIAEALQGAERWAEAVQILREASESLPSTEEFRGRRERLAFITQAAVSELQVAEGSSVLAVGLDAVGDAGAATPPVNVHISMRSQLRLILSATPICDPEVAASKIAHIANVLHQTPGGDSRVDLFVGVLQVAVQLLRLDAALRRGDDKKISALSMSARRNAELLRGRTVLLPERDAIRRFAEGSAEFKETDLDSLIRSVARIPLALPLADSAFRTPRRSKAPERLTPKQQQQAPDPTPLVVCGITLDGQPVSSVRVLRNDHLYDLALNLKLPAWPQWADRCEVRLLSIASSESIRLPHFTFAECDARLTKQGIMLSASGQLEVTVKRSAGSEPIDLPVQAVFYAGGRQEIALVAGHEHLRIRPYDPSRDLMTRHGQMDQRLIEMYTALHNDHSLDADDIEGFCRFFTACVNAAQSIMFDTTFKAGKHIRESTFHDSLEKLLRLDPALEGRLTRRDPVAGGFDDLLHDDIVAELKVERHALCTLEHCTKYVGQPTQYAVGRGSRLSILVVLDHTTKANPPAVLENNIGWLLPVQHGLTDPRYPSRVGVLIIPSAWPVPSEWSRRRRKR